MVQTPMLCVAATMYVDVCNRMAAATGTQYVNTYQYTCTVLDAYNDGHARGRHMDGTGPTLALTTMGAAF